MPRRLVVILAILCGLVAVLAIAVHATAKPTHSKTRSTGTGILTDHVHISLAGGDELGNPTSADVTYSVGDSDSGQMTVDVPMMKKSDNSEGLDVDVIPGTWIYFSAQMNEVGSQISCTLAVDGNIIARSSASVDYGIVTCDGTA